MSDNECGVSFFIVLSHLIFVCRSLQWQWQWEVLPSLRLCSLAVCAWAGRRVVYVLGEDIQLVGNGWEKKESSYVLPSFSS